MDNKVKYGLKNVYYAKATIDPTNNTATYETPVRWPGAVNLSLDAEGEQTKFRADNIDYWVGQDNDGYEGDFESALIPESFKIDILGFIKDGNGALIETADPVTQEFALLFQFEGDKKATRHVLYNCTASRPSVSGQTTEETTEPETETISLTAVSVHSTALDKDIVKASVTADETTQYNAWFESVYQPTAPTP